MPAPAEFIDGVVEASVEDHARSQDELAFLVALLWFTYGGLDDAAVAEWGAAITPVVAASRLSAAERGFAYINLLRSLQTDEALADAREALEDVPQFRELTARAERYIDAPAVRARYEISQKREERGRMISIGGEPGPAPALPRGAAAELSLPVARARAAAEAAGIMPPPGEVSDFADAMDAGAARAVQQHLGDANSAYGIGGDTAAAGSKVARWLKVPHAGACERCFLVSTRGYRTSQSAANAGHVACKCGTKAIFVRANRRGQARNVDWADAVVEGGYGGLVNAASLSPSARATLIDKLFPDLMADLESA